MTTQSRSSLTPDQILAGHASTVRGLAERLRKLIRQTISEAYEVAYPVWHAIGYRHPQAGYCCGIFPYQDHVKVYFEYGRFLPDPDRLLKGDGKQTRYVFIQHPTDIQVRAFKKLLLASIAVE